MSDDGERDRSVERQIFIRSLNMGRPLGSYSKHLAARMRETAFPAGAVLFRRGETASHIYWVVRGDVQMTHEGSEPFTLVAPSIVGVLDVMQDRLRERTATAVTAVEALVLSTADYLDIIEDNFEFARGSVRGIAGSLHMLTLSLAEKEGARARASEPPAPGALLPVPARPLNLVERTLVLYETPLFRAASVQAVTRLAGVAEELRFSEGEVIFRHGEPSSALLVVARGLVEVTRDEPRIATRVALGTLLGAYSSLSHDVREFTATALAPSSVLRIAKDDLFDLLEDHFEVTRSLIRFLASERDHLLSIFPAKTRSSVAPLPMPTASRPGASGRPGAMR